MLRKEQLKLWVERCEAQISGVLDVLEKERAAVKTTYWFGERIGHADIAVACVLRFTGEAHPQLFNAARYPALAAHAIHCEALPPFQEIVQPLSPPSGVILTLPGGGGSLAPRLRGSVGGSGVAVIHTGAVGSRRFRRPSAPPRRTDFETLIADAPDKLVTPPASRNSLRSLQATLPLQGRVMHSATKPN